MLKSIDHNNCQSSPQIRDVHALKTAVMSDVDDDDDRSTSLKSAAEFATASDKVVNQKA